MDAKVHQNKLLPEDNKFHAGNGDDGKHYWLTPPDMKERLDGQYHFDFDPCPYPKPDGFDGLTCEWGQSNYVNPPFGSVWHQGPGDKKPKKKGPTAWARKAIEEAKKGKGTNLVYPIDKWVLMLLAAGAKVFNEGDVRWLAIEDGSQGKGTGRHIARFVIGYDQADVTKTLLDACRLADGFLANKGYCENDPLVRGAIRAAIALAETEAA